MPRESVQVTGIPIDPVFADAANIGVLRPKHAVADGLPLILVLCGGFGVGPIEYLLGGLLAAVRGAQIVVVAGKNEKLRASLEQLAHGALLPTRVIGFTQEMHEWMALADICVTKPGGLTTSEALACGLPLVVANAIPGQETRNATFLYESGAGISGENPYTLGPRVAQLLASPARLEAMKRAARALARPHAALDIATELARLAAPSPPATRRPRSS